MPIRLAIAAVSAMFLIPATAHASVYCVSAPGCPGANKATLADAVAAADATKGVDDIQLGAGKFIGHAANVDAVRITGTSQTTLIPDDSVHPALTLTGAGSSVTNVAFSLEKPFQIGLQLTAGARGEMISASGAAAAHDGIAIEVGQAATLTSARVGLGGVDGVEGVRVTGVGATVTDSRIQADHGVKLSASGLVQRVKVDATRFGLIVDGGTATVTDSVLDIRDGFDGLVMAGAGTRAELAGVTIAGNDVPGSNGIRTLLGATAVVRDSIVTGVPTAFTSDGVVALDHVVRDPGSKATGTIIDGAPIVARPEFVMTGLHQFMLVPGSPLIDAGSDTSGGGTDMAGNPRVTDGDGDCAARRDPGAYEAPATATCTAEETVVPPAPPTAPAPAPAPVPVVAPAKDRTAPKLTKLKRTRTRLTFTLSERAKVTIKVTGRRAISRTARAGKNSIALRLRPGRHRVRIELVDFEGNRASVRRTL